MPQECAEHRRLARKVAEAVDTMHVLRNRMDTENFTELIRARAATREATKALDAHIAEHGCEG